jgi:hypothetical protein
VSKKVKPANTKVTRDNKGRWVKGSPSPNASGRPKDGESWSGIIKAVGDMYPEDLLTFIGKDNDLGRSIAQYPKSVQIKYLITARAFAALMFEPSSGLLNAMMERAEGKIPQAIDVNVDVTKLSIEQLERIAKGESVVDVISDPGASRD